MIGIQLKGRLGNQMFQYAAARTLAERKGSRLFLAGNTLGRRFGILGHWFGLDTAGACMGRQQNGLLSEAFAHGPNLFVGRLNELNIRWLRKFALKNTFSPKRVWIDDAQTCEIFDPAFFQQEADTWLDGWFQSENYFLFNENQVRDWFSPQDKHRQKITSALNDWSCAKDIAAIHIRRGDYAHINDSLSADGKGWLLPQEYYRKALKLLPTGTKLAIFSDDPIWAAHAFADWKPWVSSGNDAVVDLLLMAQCRWIIAANSSFSWWAGWLNSRSDKIVIAPKYHLGWRISRWVPENIAVKGWRYLSVGN